MAASTPAEGAAGIAPAFVASYRVSTDKQAVSGLGCAAVRGREGTNDEHQRQ
jgi:hypothetical protein